MSSVEVRPVLTRRQKRLFLGYPWVLYEGDPNWTPPLRSNQKELVGYAPHPFYERNEGQTFLAYRDGEVSGRIAAVLNRGHIEKFAERRGFFGFFESVDDQEVADGLFEAARQWLAERDVRKIRGPTNPSTNYECGTLIEGYDSPATFGLTYNPPYYPRLIEGHGFRKTQDLYAFWANLDMLPDAKAKRGHLPKQIEEHYNIVVRPMDTSRFVEEVEAFLDIFNRSLVAHWGHVPMTSAEVRHIAKGMGHLIIPELALAAEIDGRMVGAVFCMPDYNPRIKRIDGRLFPFGFIRLLWKKQSIKKVRVISANVLPEYQLLGVGLVLLAGLLPKGLEWGMEEGEFSWVAESNLLSRGSLEKGGAKRVKTYRVYDLDG